MRNKVTTTIVVPAPGEAYINCRSASPDGDEVYSITVRIDDDANLHKWLAAESWTKAAYGGRLHAQRPSEAICTTIGVPRNKAVGIAECIGRLCSLGGPPVTAVKSTGFDCRVCALSIIYDVPRDALGIPQVRPAVVEQAPEVLAHLEAERKRKAEDAMYLKADMDSAKQQSRDLDKRMAEEKRELKSMANKTAKEFMRRARELAVEKGDRYKRECRERGERWATGKGYADLALPMRDAPTLHAAGVSEQDEQARCHAAAFEAEKMDQASITRYHEIINSWRPQQVRWDELTPSALAMYNRQFDLYVAGVRAHSDGYSDEQIGELFWDADERKHVIVDENYYKERRHGKGI